MLKLHLIEQWSRQKCSERRNIFFGHPPSDLQPPFGVKGVKIWNLVWSNCGKGRICSEWRENFFSSCLSTPQLPFGVKGVKIWNFISMNIFISSGDPLRPLLWVMWTNFRKFTFSRLTNQRKGIRCCLQEWKWVFHLNEHFRFE